MSSSQGIGTGHQWVVVQRSYAQRPESQDRQDHGAVLGEQATCATARGSKGQGMQCNDPMDGDVADQEPTRALPQGDGRGNHGARDRVPIPRPVGRPRACAHWDGNKWVLDPDAALRFKEKYRRAKDLQNERRRATRQLLKEMEKPKIRQTTLI